MKRLLSILCLSLALLPLTGMARTISDFFASEPGNIFPLLTRTGRLDMVDYYNSGKTVAIANNLEGESSLLQLDSAYLKVQTSKNRIVEMRMRTAGKDTVITVIETVMTPVPDSRLTQWNVHWQRFTSDKLFAMPGIDDFIIRKMPHDLRADLQDAMIFPLVQLTFKGEGHDIIEAAHGLEQFLAKEEYQRYSSYLKPSISYRFNGLKIKPVK
ncbi:MAG: DUF3256 family protein [Muribaculaceae bacterium]|jgi:hypothetical protein|nr:DUF3256 family protein [Muribaculaceae bacterium]